MSYNRGAAVATIAAFLIPLALFIAACASVADSEPDTSRLDLIDPTPTTTAEMTRYALAEDGAEPVDMQHPDDDPPDGNTRRVSQLEGRDLIERVVEAEAGGEDFTGQVLVAQCILNTSHAKGIRPEDVVQEIGQYVKPAKSASDSVKDAVTAVFDNGYAVTAEPIRFFYAPRQRESKWHEENLEFVLEHGGHRFFKIRSDNDSSV